MTENNHKQQPNAIKKVICYSDGSCLGNPGPGGWAALLRYKENERVLFGAEDNTTNNRMELTAAIEGLRALKESCAVTIVTDSEYVKKGITEWMVKWKQNGWRTANRKDVKNVDLWQQLDEQVQKHQVSWQWVKGHSGHPENERVDKLARDAILQLQREIK